MNDRSTVLVVDDNLDQRTILSALLQYFGYATEEAANGQQAAQLAEELRPDIIFMDLQRPLVDGITAPERSKANPELKDIPIVAITAFDFDPNLIEGAGFNFFLLKPVVPSQVLGCITSLLPGGGKSSSPGVSA